jgi:arabinofuranosyltransferase
MRRGAGFWLGLALFALLVFGIRDYVIDDTFIHLQFAKHVRDGAGLVFNLGDPVPGATAPLWPLCLGWLARGGADLLPLAKAMSLVAGLVALALFATAAHRLTLRREHAEAATAAWAANAWMARWTPSGMETALAVLLVLAGWVVAWGRGAPASPRRRFGVGLVWGLAALARPEAALLVALYAAAAALWPFGSRGPATVRDRVGAAVAALLGAAVVVAPYAVYALGLYGSVLPQTLAAKGAGAVGAAVAASQLLHAAKIVGAVCAVEALACLCLLPRFATLWRQGDTALHAAAWGWLLLVPVGYALRGVLVLSRYLVPLLPLLVLYAWWGLEHLRLSNDTPWRRAVLAAALGASLGLNLAVYRVQVLEHAEEFTLGMHRTLIPWGEWLAANTPVDALVATPDIGAIAYYSDRRVLDLGGLVSPGIEPLMDRMDYDALVRDFAFRDVGRPGYLVDRGVGPRRLLLESPFGPALAPVFSARTQSLGITKPGPVDYTLYRVDWAIADSLAAARSARASRADPH